MSWLRLICLVGVALAVSACQVRPLYAPTPDGVGALQALPAIEVDGPSSRPEQVFRNALIFAMRGGGEGAPARYRLNFRVNLAEQELGIEPITGTPASYQLRGSVSFVLRDAASDAVLIQDSATAVASYNRSTQNFANIRARRDAEDRVAESLAQLVHVRLASLFAER